jgi:thymidylate synthase ThyX
MRVQQVSIIATDEAKKINCIGLTPELLAATGARYSRSNDGLQAITSKIDWANTNKSVDSIFRMVDYGHASIADMAPVAMFIDEISLFAAYFLWANCPTASGQESSTRYIKMDKAGVMDPKELGIRNEKSYYKHIEKAFKHYETALNIWTGVANSNPSAMKIPQEVILDKSEKGQKKLQRIVRNFAFDRARVYLPVCAKTNVMLVMSARSWVEIISALLSSQLQEFQTIGTKLREQLAIVTPRLIKHAIYKEDIAGIYKHIFEKMRHQVSKGVKKNQSSDGAFFTSYGNYPISRLIGDLKWRTNRYSPSGDSVRMTPVTFGWKRIAFAEMRDLNRHRTGQKMSLLIPNGFYDATEQADSKETGKKLTKLSLFGISSMDLSNDKLTKGDLNYFYNTLLGHTYEFTHTTTLDKYIYEAELRTGVGAHYRYALHLKNTLKIFYDKYPLLKKLVHEGLAEPE